MISHEDSKWLDTAEQGWQRLRLPLTVGHETFVSGDPSGRRLSVRYFRDAPGAALIAKAVFGPGTQGPPGHAHGGSMAALLDEAMGAAAWMHGHRVVAADLGVRFRNMLPLGSRCVVRAEVTSVEGRKVNVKSALSDGAGYLYAEGEALFVTLDPSKFGQLAAAASQVFAEAGASSRAD